MLHAPPNSFVLIALKVADVTRGHRHCPPSLLFFTTYNLKIKFKVKSWDEKMWMLIFVLFTSETRRLQQLIVWCNSNAETHFAVPSANSCYSSLHINEWVSCLTAPFVFLLRTESIVWVTLGSQLLTVWPLSMVLEGHPAKDPWGCKSVCPVGENIISMRREGLGFPFHIIKWNTRQGAFSKGQVSFSSSRVLERRKSTSALEPRNSAVGTCGFCQWLFFKDRWRWLVICLSGSPKGERGLSSTCLGTSKHLKSCFKVEGIIDWALTRSANETFTC